MRRLVVSVLLGLLLVLSACSGLGGESSVDRSLSSASSAPISPESEAVVLTEEEALERVQEHFGEKDEATGNTYSIAYEGMVNVDGADCYNFRISWLVDGDHMSYLTNYIVSLDGNIMQEYSPDAPEGTQPTESTAVRTAADALLDLIRLSPQELKNYIDPDEGLTFTPCATVSETDRTVTAEDFSTFFSDRNLYTWGTLNGQAISLTGSEYWKKFVWDGNGPYFSPDSVVENSESTLLESDPDRASISYHFEAQNSSGFTLTLSLHREEDNWYLCGLIYNAAE